MHQISERCSDDERYGSSSKLERDPAFESVYDARRVERSSKKKLPFISPLRLDAIDPTNPINKGGLQWHKVQLKGVDKPHEIHHNSGEMAVLTSRIRIYRIPSNRSQTERSNSALASSHQLSDIIPRKEIKKDTLKTTGTSLDSFNGIDSSTWSAFERVPKCSSSKVCDSLFSKPSSSFPSIEDEGIAIQNNVSYIASQRSLRNIKAPVSLKGLCLPVEKEYDNAYKKTAVTFREERRKTDPHTAQLQNKHFLNCDVAATSRIRLNTSRNSTPFSWRLGTVKPGENLSGKPFYNGAVTSRDLPYKTSELGTWKQANLATCRNIPAPPPFKSVSDIRESASAPQETFKSSIAKFLDSIISSVAIKFSSIAVKSKTLKTREKSQEKTTRRTFRDETGLDQKPIHWTLQQHVPVSDGKVSSKSHTSGFQSKPSQKPLASVANMSEKETLDPKDFESRQVRESVSKPSKDIDQCLEKVTPTDKINTSKSVDAVSKGYGYTKTTLPNVKLERDSYYVEVPGKQSNPENRLARTYISVNKTPEKVKEHRISQIAGTRLEPNQYLQSGIRKSNVKFSWAIARSLIKLKMQPSHAFVLNGIPWKFWKLRRIPTLGASPTSCRVQEMHEATIPARAPGDKKLKVFIKCIPINVWIKQWESQNKWEGEFVTDGENFVMEAAVLVFLQQYSAGISPRLLAVLELEDDSENTESVNLNSSHGTHYPLTSVKRIAIVSEFYGEDLLDFLERREKEKRRLTDKEKLVLQYECLVLLDKLHSIGLAHLDFTPENVLLGDRGLRLCDFAKATPITSCFLRHIKTPLTNPFHCYPFESCEPTVGKGAYMPPECWKVYWRLEDTRVKYPLRELWFMSKQSERSLFYFNVDKADVFMLGVLLFWLWSGGGIWKSSDAQQDEKFAHLIKSGMNFDLFKECRSWSLELKNMLQGALRPDPIQRSTLKDLLIHPWFLKLKTEFSAETK